MARKKGKSGKVRTKRKQRTMLTHVAQTDFPHHNTGNPTRPVTTTPAVKSNVRTISLPLLRQSFWLLVLTILVYAAIAAVVFLKIFPDGKNVVSAFGGILEGNNLSSLGKPTITPKIVLLLDTLFPVFYGSSFAVLATALQSSGNRPLVRLILTTLLVIVVADFIENAMVTRVLAGEENHILQPALTMVKFAGLAFAGVILSVVLPGIGFWGKVSRFMLRFALPGSVAFLLSGINVEIAQYISGPIFLITLVSLAVFSWLLQSR